MSESATISRSTDVNPWDQYEFSVPLSRVGYCLKEVLRPQASHVFQRLLGDICSSSCTPGDKLASNPEFLLWPKLQLWHCKSAVAV